MQKWRNIEIKFPTSHISHLTSHLLPFSIFKYLITAQDEHAIHSPFVFDLYCSVIKKDEQLPKHEAITALRRKMLLSQEDISITDFGAGSKINRSNLRKVKDIAKNSQKPPRLGRLFYRLIQHFGSKTIIDLGTSLGMTTAFLASANTNGKVNSFEGCPETAKVAVQNFEQLDLKNIEVIIGNIDETLQKTLPTLPSIDFVFFDANHRYEPTVKYFETCLEYAHEESLFVFDDIHWSAEMEQAWEYIKAHSSVTLTIDLLWVGLVFFRKKQPKQNFTLRFPLL